MTPLDRLHLTFASLVAVFAGVIAWAVVSTILLPSIIWWTVTRSWPADDGR